MQVPFVVSGEKPKITIMLDNRHPDVKKAMHCFVCGKVFLEYYSDIRVVLPGEGDPSEAPLVVQCHGMTTTYNQYGQPVNGRCKAQYWII